MDQQCDPASVFTAMHHRVTGELLHLMDGLYSNIEDGLFELAFRTRDENQKRRCFDLMREMRFQRSRVVQSFAKRLQGSFEAWLRADAEDTSQALNPQGERMAHKSMLHFSGVLRSLSERAGYALGRDLDPTHLPMGPYQVACHFIQAMKSLEFDDQSIDIVEELFSRFVLERLGSVYGECNQRLEQAGFCTTRRVGRRQRAGGLSVAELPGSRPSTPNPLPTPRPLFTFAPVSWAGCVDGVEFLVQAPARTTEPGLAAASLNIRSRRGSTSASDVPERR